jgi:hypothetical protein
VPRGSSGQFARLEAFEDDLHLAALDLAGHGDRLDAYQAIIAYRKDCATFEFILVDGVPAA